MVNVIFKDGYTLKATHVAERYDSSRSKLGSYLNIEYDKNDGYKYVIDELLTNLTTENLSEITVTSEEDTTLSTLTGYKYLIAMSSQVLANSNYNGIIISKTNNGEDVFV